MNPTHQVLLAVEERSPAAVSPLALLSGIGMILVALGVAAYVGRRRLGWGAFALGAAAWGVTVALKFAWAIPLNPPIYTAVTQALPALGAPLFMLYVGALTGIFEVGLLALLLALTHTGAVAWPRAVAFGLGFGAAEALWSGVVSLSSTLAAMLIGMIHPPSPEVAAQLGNIQWVLAPVVERIAAVVIHCCANALLFYALSTGRARWFWLAFGLKTAVDAAAAACVHLHGMQTLAHLWTLEGLLLLFGLAAWLGLRWLAPRYLALPHGAAAAEPRLAHGAA